MLAQKIQNIIEGFKESLTGSLISITSDHAYIHKGKAFTISLSFGSISSAYYIVLETPAASVGYIHFRPLSATITTDANSVSYVMHEAITSYTGGTSYTPFNRNRNSSSVFGGVVKYGVTPTIGSAIQLDHMIAGTTGNPNSRGGGNSGGNDEIVLLPETKYLFGFTPGGATNVNFNVFWYQESYGA